MIHDSLTSILGGWRGAHLCLIVDFDRALTHPAGRPSDTHLPAPRRAVVASLASLPSATVGLVSSRRVSQMRDFFGADRRLYYAGLRGLEIEGPHVSLLHLEAARAVDLLASTSATIEAAVRLVPGAFVEDRGLSIVVHVAAVPEPRDRAVLLRRVLDAASPHVQARRLSLLTRADAFELHANLAWSTADAVREITSAVERRKGRCWPVYIGDALASPEAFGEASRQGITITVGAGPGRSPFQLGGPEEVESLLMRLLGATRGTWRSGPRAALRI